jgi:hypothetical protein
MWSWSWSQCFIIACLSLHHLCIRSIDLPINDWNECLMSYHVLLTNTCITAIFILIDQNLQNSYSHFCLLLEWYQTEARTLATFVTCLWNTSTTTADHHHNAWKPVTYTKCCKAAVVCYVHTWHDIEGSASDRIQLLNSQSSSSALATHRLCHLKTSGKWLSSSTHSTGHCSKWRHKSIWI